MDSAFLLPIAYLLAFLNYYLGVFLLAIPVPHRGLKRFARFMLQDGIAYAFLAPIALSIPTAVHVAELYFSYDSQNAFVNLSNWLGFTENGFPITNGIIQEITNVYTSVILKILLSSTVIVFGKAVSTLQLRYADLLTTVLSDSIFSLQMLFYFTLFIWKLALPMLVSMGAVIYGLPARFGRHPGAALIATGLVFYIGLPFMPYYVNMFVLPDRPRSADIAALVDQFQGNVTSFNKKYGEVGAVRWKISPMSGPQDYYCILTRDNIVMWTDGNGEGEYPLPAGEYTYTLTHFGDVGYLSGSFTVGSNQTTEVTLTYPTWNFGMKGSEEHDISIGDAKTGGVDIKDVSPFTNLVMIRIWCPVGNYVAYVDVTINNRTALSNFHIEGDAVGVSTVQQERSQLYQIPIDLQRYGNATRSCSFTIERTSPTEHFPPNHTPHVQDMGNDAKGLFTDQFKIFRPMFDFSASILLTTIILPATYLLLLAGIGREVAKLLGGRRLPIPEVI